MGTSILCMFLCEEMKLRSFAFTSECTEIWVICISVRQNKFRRAEMLPRKDETPSLVLLSMAAGAGYGRL